MDYVKRYNWRQCLSFVAEHEDMRLKTKAYKLIGAVAISFAGISPSYAYLDPGTGSIILQGILATVAVTFGIVRLYWQRFKAIISNLGGSQVENVAEASEQPQRESHSLDQS